ncbi:MAG: long-chain fatty acid--CoA ligase, partial [Gammaproteobacteria bacterium]|nr:long-chain fatty acid--CoA ligase [Gammaproteobacteria bacterium]
MLNQFDLTEKRAELHPQRIAFYEPERDLQISYGDLDQQATALAAALQNRGYAPGARIAVLCLNRHEFFTLLFACAKASLILVPLNWRLAVGELVPMLEDCGAELLIYDEANQQTTSCLAEATAIDTLAMDATTDEESLATLLASTVQDFSCRSEWPADEIWYMLYTSGTTGTPKAVLQTFGMALANYVNIDQAIDLTSRDITLNFLPLFHTAGINLYTLPHLISGAAIVIHSRFDPAAVLRELQQRITTFFGVPAIYQALSLDPRFHQT